MSEWNIHLVNRLFQPIELLLRRNAQRRDDLKPLWIVGAPRTGTTLTYQILTSAFKSSYLTNYTAKRYRIALVARNRELSRKTQIKPQSFSSTYGKTPHKTDPHEGGQFFYQFFSRNSEQVLKNRSSGEYLAQLVSEVSKPHDLFISKNTIHSLRITAFHHIFPKSKFIRVTRDPVDTIYSIFRKRMMTNELDWWGIQPPGWEQMIKKPIIEQVTWQYLKTEELIRNQLHETDADSCRIKYDELCRSPLKVSQAVAKKLNIQDHLEPNPDLPKSFEVKSHHIDSTVQQQIEQSIDIYSNE